MRVLGLDEAGRGCVLGPLVVGAFCCDAAKLDLLRPAGANDSKQLRPAARVKAREALRALGEAKIAAISPAEIDAGNINTLEESAFAALILALNPDEVFIDAPCNPRAIPAFTARLIRRLADAGRASPPRFVIEPKADGTYPVVGAASIFAKVARDAEIEALGPVGSGYPSDPVTRAWLLGFLERGEPLPPSVRQRWGTLDNLRQQRLL